MRRQPDPAERLQAAMCAVAPGDVLVVKGSGRLTRIGANGGFMGHVMVVMATPERVVRNSKQGRALADIWPEGAEEVWKVSTTESTRQNSGLHQCRVVIHAAAGEFRLIGEETDSYLAAAGEAVEIWRCPAELRKTFRPEIVTSVMKDMFECQADWSYRTAARAVFQSASMAYQVANDSLREEVEASWEIAPICTSVVITFWQRYLQGLAEMTGASDLQMWLRWMPLKADRGLPGELLQTMQATGWTQVEAPKRR